MRHFLPKHVLFYSAVTLTYLLCACNEKSDHQSSEEKNNAGIISTITYTTTDSYSNYVTEVNISSAQVKYSKKQIADTNAQSYGVQEHITQFDGWGSLINLADTGALKNIQIQTACSTCDDLSPPLFQFPKTVGNTRMNTLIYAINILHRYLYILLIYALTACSN